MQKNTVQLVDVTAFVQKYGFKIMLRGAISLGVVAILLAAYYALAPRSESYKLELQVSLPEKEGVLVYENDTPFSTSDLVAAPLLRQLWSGYGFAERGVKFVDFSSAFAAYSWNKERAAIDAELAAKLSKRNVTVADIASAQKDYEQKLATLDKHSFALSFTAKGIATDRDETARMLADLPMRWAERARRVYALPIPKLADAASVKAGLERFAKLPMAEFDTIDYLRQYCAQMRATCKFARDVMKSQNIVQDGVTVGMLEARIDLAMREIDQLYVTLMSLQGGNKEALRFAKGRRETLACDIMTTESQIAAVKAAIAALTPASAKAEKGGEAGVMLQADGNFLGQYTSLVKNSVHADEVKKYLADQVRLEGELADLKSRDLAYAQVEKSLSDTNMTANAVDCTESLKAMVEGVITTGAAVESFRDYVMDNSLLPGDFFKVQEPVYYSRSFHLSLPRTALLLLALWALYNLIGLIALWSRKAE